MPTLTPSFNLELVDFDTSPWSDLEHNNWRILDAVISKYISVPQLSGIWAVSTAYDIGDILVDKVSGQLYICLVAHTSASSGLFSTDRTANPTYWGVWAVNDTAFSTPEEFGAKGSSTDDAVALQEVIDHAITVGKKTVQLTKLYRSDTELSLGSGLRIEGVGDESGLDFSNMPVGSNGLSYTGATLDDVRLANFRVLGPSSDAGGGGANNGIFVRTTGDNTRIKVDSVTTDNWGIGIYIDATNPGVCQSPEVTRCHVNACSRAGILVENARHGLVEGNFVDGDRTGVGDGTDTDVNIWLPAADPGDESKFMRVVNNTTKNGALESIIVHTKFSTIGHNTVEDPGTAGIVVETASNATTKAHGELHNTLTSNTISGTAADGIIVRHDPANNTVAPGYNEISDNTINGTGLAIRIGQAGASTNGPFDNGINDNRCTNQTGVAISVDDAEGTSLDGNKVSESGGACINVSGASKRTSIEGGSLNATGTDTDGIVISETAANTHITGVMFANCNRYGVRPTGTPSDIFITSNTFVDDQGVPTMNAAVAAAAGAVNVQVWGNNAMGMTDAADYSGVLADPQKMQIGSVELWVGTGSPEGVVTANIGAEFWRLDGGAGTSGYRKESGTGNTGWVAK